MNQKIYKETIQSLLNWNDMYIGIQPNNGELRDGLLQSLRGHSLSLKRYNYSNYCIVLNLWNVDHVDHSESVHTTRTSRQQHQQQPRQQQNPQKQQRRRTLITYLLYKLTQLCLLIVLLLPFLVTYNTLIQQASGQYVTDPISLSLINSKSNLKSNESLNIEAIYEHLLQSQTERKFYDYKTIKHKNIRNNNHIIFKSNSPIYSYNNRLPEYSLIILSQSANILNSGVAKTRILSTNTDSILNEPMSTWTANSSSTRTKRYIYNNNNSPIREIKNEKHGEADIQNFKVTIEKFTDNYNMNKEIINNEAKLTKLVMNGLGLKKLPDMKKANISQIEYSSKYLEYLERLRNSDARKNSDDQIDSATSLQILSIVTNKVSEIKRKRWRHKRVARSTEKRWKKTLRKGSDDHNPADTDKTNILLHFPLSLHDGQFKYEQINEANVRLMMLYNPALAVSSRPDAISRGNRRKIINRHQNEKYVKNEKDCNNDNYEIPLIKKQTQKKSNRKSKTHVLNLKVYQILRMNKRHQLDARRIEFENSNYRRMSDETRSQWLEFDVTGAVRAWINKSHDNLGIEIQCDKCRRIGARILSEVSSPSHQLVEESEVREKFHLTPVLNIIGHVGRTHSEEAVHPHNLTSNNQSNVSFNHHRLNYGHPNKIQKPSNSCYRAHQRCCRHQLDVTFKDIKGFEFIIQPKTFDAGYCKGRCPPRHNPAHHHALLQSLIWQQDRNRVPRPCCAPSKLTEIEILHVDEEHSDKLKISTWSNMQVMECACS